MRSSLVTRAQQVDKHCLNLTSAALALAADEAAIVFVLVLFEYLRRLTTEIYRQQFSIID
jgi:hypothetical protein